MIYIKRKWITILAGLLVALALAGCAARTASPEPVFTQAVRSPTAAIPAGLPTPTIAAGDVRRSTIAGTWYPDDPGELATMIDEFLGAVEPVDGAPLGLVVPHAGYVYSGQVAAYGFKQLLNGDYEVAVIIASDHQSPLSDPISVWAEGGFETPLGVVAVDEELAGALIAADPRITFDRDAHAGEHPIEIELPFLQRVCPHCRIVPVLMGAEDEASVEALAEALASVLPGRRAVVIASSDLSHYPSYEYARAVDGGTLGAIESGDPAQVRARLDELMAMDIPNLLTCACGAGPILTLMRVAQELGADTISVLRYANSGDSSYGSPDQVVGYGAVMFWHYQAPELDEAQRQELLELARDTLEAYLGRHVVPPYEGHDPALARRAGVFVTLLVGDELRGCIGHTRGDMPLYQAAQEMTIAAATEDPRFPPLDYEELAEVTIEISVLSPMRLVNEISQIQVGTHGLMLFKGNNRGLLLPQVAVDEGWDRGAFLENICLKAGLPEDCWEQGATLYTFTALVFGEE